MDAYFKKEIIYTFEGKKYAFDIGETLFSTFNIDHGTDILIRAISPAKNPTTILDLGCGYGPIGICLAGKFPTAVVTMIDRDLLEVRYAKNNADKNRLNNISVQGSVGLEAVTSENFDLIISNIPAKIGDEAITKEFLLDPVEHLSPDGEFWFVVVNALNRLVPKVCRQNELKLQEVRSRNGHTVYKIRK
jgi:16S rRNA G1207 methylase RsmC